MQKTLVIIAGPTASGKTDLTVWLARQLGTEVISADSRQIYREMFIGTARPAEEELQGVPHHFLAVKSVKDYYNAYMYEQDALQKIAELFERYDVLLMVGGSTLYIDAVVRGIDEIPTVLPSVRKELSRWYEEQGIEKMRSLLRRLDRDYYSRADLNNPMRLLKALEVSIQSGRPYSSFLTGSRKKRDFNILLIGIDWPRQILYERINKRVDLMIEKGLVREARELYPLRDYTALKTVGYKEIFDYFDGKHSLAQAIDLIKRNTRKYARRQLTWFRRYPDIKWFSPPDRQKILAWIEQNLTK